MPTKFLAEYPLDDSDPDSYRLLVSHKGFAATNNLTPGYPAAGSYTLYPFCGHASAVFSLAGADEPGESTFMGDEDEIMRLICAKAELALYTADRYGLQLVMYPQARTGCPVVILQYGTAPVESESD